MAITCLDNMVGLRGTCNDTTPVSGKYINDYPGIELRALSALTTSEQADFEEVWQRIYRRSVNELESDVTVRMQKYFKTRLLIENRQVGYYLSPAETEAMSAHYKGVALNLYGSNYTKIYINSIGLYLFGSATVTVKIFNYKTGDTLDTLTFDGVAGNNTFEVNKSYDSFGQRSEIFVAYNATAVDSIETNVYHPMDVSPENTSMRGAKLSTASAALEANMLFEGNTYGLTVNFNVQCSIERLICSVRDLLVSPLIYKLAEQIFVERSMSTRLNKFTLFNEEEAEALKQKYAQQYLMTLDSVLNQIEPAEDGFCVFCEKERTYKYMMP